MSNNIEYQLVVSSNEDVVAASFLTFYDGNIEEYYKQEMVTNIKF